MSTEYAPGLHVVKGRVVDASAYDRWVGRWSRLFVPSLLAAAQVSSGCIVLDVATGSGEAALTALSTVGSSGTVVGADIALEMLEAARVRLNAPSFRLVAADGQALPFRDNSFDAVTCQLGLQFFPDPPSGLAEFNRVLRRGCCAAVCVISTPDRAPMFGILADVLSGFVPDQRDLLHLSFALADANLLEEMFASAGFREVRVERVQRKDTIGSFDEYWNPIETGVGSQPQLYVGLPETDRRAVREEVKLRLSPFLSDGRLTMSIEMLIGVGRV